VFKSTPKGNRSSFAFSSYLWKNRSKVVPLCGKIAQSVSIAWKIRQKFIPRARDFSIVWKNRAKFAAALAMARLLARLRRAL